MEKIRVVKIGGNVIDNPEQTQAFLTDFARLSGAKILGIHGGGKRASRMLAELNIPVRMHEGRRITDAPTLEVIRMVYGGLINKNLTASLQALNCPAVGLDTPAVLIDCVKKSDRGGRRPDPGRKTTGRNHRLRLCRRCQKSKQQALNQFVGFRFLSGYRSADS